MKFSSTFKKSCSSNYDYNEFLAFFKNPCGQKWESNNQLCLALRWQSSNCKCPIMWSHVINDVILMHFNAQHISKLLLMECLWKGRCLLVKKYYFHSNSLILQTVTTCTQKGWMFTDGYKGWCDIQRIG